MLERILENQSKSKELDLSEISTKLDKILAVLSWVQDQYPN